jgi:hypothetical protein
VLWIRINFFRIWIHNFFVGIGSKDSYFDPKVFQMVPRIAFMCSGTCTSEKKISNIKTYFFFSFKCLICNFSQDFKFYNSVWIRIHIRTFFSDSDPAKAFGFGSTTLLGMIPPYISPKLGACLKIAPRSCPSTGSTTQTSSCLATACGNIFPGPMEDRVVLNG